MIVIKDEIKAIIDSIRYTDSVDTFTYNGNGTYTIYTPSTYSLQENFKIVLKYSDSTLNRDAVISSLTGSSITIPGTNIPTPDNWELALYFETGHRLELHKKYTNKAKSVNKKIQEYPLFWLYSDTEKRPSNYEDAAFETTLQAALVDFSELNLYENERIDNNFKPVLYPLLEIINEAFNTLPNKAKFVTPYGIDKEINFSLFDRPFFGSFDKSQNVLPQITDAIEFSVNLNWRNQTNVCSGY